MKKIITILFLILLVLEFFSQNLIKIEGQIQVVSYYQGGMELPDEYKLPKPIANQSIILVKYNGSENYSTYVSTITTDKNGEFEIELPGGMYGFVTTDQKNQLKDHKGLYLPIQANVKSEINFDGVDVQDYWSMNSISPFEVSENNSTKMILTHYQITICYLCP